MINDYEATEPIVPVPSEQKANDEVISTLNGLIETCRDGQYGFQSAAEGVERSDLKTIFLEYSQQRAQFVGALQGLVRSLGGDPENAGSMSGAVHRGWMDIKAAVTGKDESAILNECERGEDSAKEAYSDALKTNLPANIAEVLIQQSQAVNNAHDRIKSLRNAERARSASQN
ncbi:MAG: PA2169 family four-helix-bundle protein [Pyrinomonadaceae bacterium]